MSEELVERIRVMEDFRLLRFFDSFGTSIITSLDLDRDQLLKGVSPIARDNPEVARVLRLQVPREKASAPLDNEDAVIVARNTLEAMARHPGLAPGLETALDEFKDKEMPAMTIVALGFAISMIIMAATMKFNVRFENGKVKGVIAKEVAPPETLKEVVGHLSSAAAKVLPLA